MGEDCGRGLWTGTVSEALWTGTVDRDCVVCMETGWKTAEHWIGGLSGTVDGDCVQRAVGPLDRRRAGGDL